MAVENIVFDLGGVLVKSSHDDWLKLISHFTPIREDQELMYNSCNGSNEWFLRDCGKMSLEEATAEICARMPERLREPTRNYMYYWYKWREPKEAICALVGELKEKGYGVYLLSNVCDLYHKLRDYLPVLTLFDGEFVSSDWQLIKPNPKIYLTFLNQFGLSAEECFFIDDNKGNVDASLKTGFSGGYVFNDDVNRLRTELRRHGVIV